MSGTTTRTGLRYWWPIVLPLAILLFLLLMLTGRAADGFHEWRAVKTCDEYGNCKTVTRTLFD